MVTPSTTPTTSTTPRVVRTTAAATSPERLLGVGHCTSAARRQAVAQTQTQYHTYTTYISTYRDYISQQLSDKWLLPDLPENRIVSIKAVEKYFVDVVAPRTTKTSRLAMKYVYALTLLSIASIAKGSKQFLIDLSNSRPQHPTSDQPSSPS